LNDFTLSEVFPSGSSEYQILSNAYGLIIAGIPQIAAEYKNKLIALDASRAELSSLYFMINRNISKLKATIQTDYDGQYTRLVKIGRPSNTAIEAEIRFNNPDYLKVSNQIEELENVKNLIVNYMKCIDNCRLTTTELFKDSRRID